MPRYAFIFRLSEYKIEKAKIAKLLSCIENGQVGKFVNKTPDETEIRAMLKVYILI